MFDVLLSGRLRGTPEVRTSRNGNPFATFRLNVPTGKDGSYTQASCICFSQTAIELMSALTDGDSVAVTGEAVIKTWEGKNGIATGLDVTVHTALTAYQVKKKRGAGAGDKASAEPDEPSHRDASPEFSGHDQPLQRKSSPERPKFTHPGFEQPDMHAPMPDGWDNLEGV
jgi:single-stranded DNA-binding protein